MRFKRTNQIEEANVEVIVSDGSAADIHINGILVAWIGSDGVLHMMTLKNNDIETLNELGVQIKDYSIKTI